MVISALSTLAMLAHVGPQWLGHFVFIPIFSLMTLYFAPAAYFAARRHDIRTHRNNMIGLYLGGIIIAESFAFMRGRLLRGWLFG